MTSRILLFSDHVEKDKGTDRKIERNKEQGLDKGQGRTNLQIHSWGETTQ